MKVKINQNHNKPSKSDIYINTIYQYHTIKQQANPYYVNPYIDFPKESHVELSF